jgi:hypothetical protein
VGTVNLILDNQNLQKVLLLSAKEALFYEGLKLYRDPGFAGEIRDDFPL